MSASIATGINTLLTTNINFDALIVALGEHYNYRSFIGHDCWQYSGHFLHTKTLCSLALHIFWLDKAKNSGVAGSRDDSIIFTTKQINSKAKS